MSLLISFKGWNKIISAAARMIFSQLVTGCQSSEHLISCWMPHLLFERHLKLFANSSEAFWRKISHLLVFGLATFLWLLIRFPTNLQVFLDIIYCGTKAQQLFQIYFFQRFLCLYYFISLFVCFHFCFEFWTRFGVTRVRLDRGFVIYHLFW